MLKKILLFCTITTIFLAIASTLKLSHQVEVIEKSNLLKIARKETNQIGNLEIAKINLNEPLFKIDSQENNIEEHVTILKESIFPTSKESIVFLAAHSGDGRIAYFEELDNLKKNDKIILSINNKTYTYFVKDIWEEEKTGYININKESTNQLILTTCSPNHKGYQLIVNCIQRAN